MHNLSRTSSSEQRVVDGPTEEIHALLTADRWRNGLPAKIAQLEFRIRQAFGTTGPVGTLGPIEARRVLLSTRHLIEAELQKVVARYSPYRWLWYLRRVPQFVFKGAYRSTSAYDATLAECVSGRSGASSTFRTAQDGGVGFRVKNDVVEVLIDYCLAIRALSQIHSNLRWAGKSASINFNESVLGAPEPTADLERAVELYDLRSDDDGSFFRRVGTTATDADGIGPDNILSIERMTEQIGPLFYRPESKATGRLCFAPTFLSLSTVGALNSDHRIRRQWWEPQLPSLAMFLRIALDLAFRSRLGFSIIQMLGYNLVERSEFLEAAQDHWNDACALAMRSFPDVVLPVSPERLVDEMQQDQGSLWPLRAGPPIRAAGELLCLDLYAATQQFQIKLQFPGETGEIANARADHFEEGVQLAVDNTHWRPSEHLRDFVGREIRCDGNTLTDIDAIGESNGSLLLLSCKSKIYSAEYDAGDFPVVRNQAEAVVEAVNHWKQLIEFVRARPVGDNYDFQRFNAIIGVVVLPHVVYVPLGQALDFVLDGLRAAVSAKELTDWLNNQSGV